MNKKILFLLLSSLFAGCLLKNDVNVKVLIPEVPALLAASGKNITVELKYYSDGRLEAVSGFEPGDDVYIEIAKEVVPFTAYPVIQDEGIQLKPAGGIFPEDFNGEELELSWKDGYASETVLYLSEKGINFSNFNIGRFEEILLDKSDGNPWKVSEMPVCYALSAGIFNSNHVSVKRSVSVELSDSFLAGTWIFADPLACRIYESSDGRIQLDDIYEGRHVLVSLDAPVLKYAEIFADNGRWAVFFSGGEGGLSGNF